MTRNRRIWAGLFLSVPLAVYVAIVVLPLLSSFYFSLTDWNGFNSAFKLVGLDNFTKITRDPLFSNALKNTVLWTIAAVIIPTVAGLGLALALHEKVRGANFFKSIFYLPVCLSLAVIGQVWIWIYQPDWGLINTVLRALGLQDIAVAWLAKPEFALMAVIVAWSWQQIALAMVIFLAGLTSIPAELTEAAEIDGANYGQSVRHVVVPLLAPATTVVIALSIINSLKSFDVVYVMTRGGPFHASDTLAMMMYNESFQKYYIGYGSAVSVVLFLIALVLIAIYFRQMRSLEHLYD